MFVYIVDNVRVIHTLLLLLFLYVLLSAMSTKRTYQPKKQKRARKHGFLARIATAAGRRVIKTRRRRGRTKLAVNTTVK